MSKKNTIKMEKKFGNFLKQFEKSYQRIFILVYITISESFKETSQVKNNILNAETKKVIS